MILSKTLGAKKSQIFLKQYRAQSECLHGPFAMYAFESREKLYLLATADSDIHIAT